MNNKITFLFFLSFLFSINGIAQQLEGTILNDEGEILIGATVRWENTSIATTTNVEGRFSIEKKEEAANLEITYVGYSPILIPIEPEEQDVNIEISGITALTEVEIIANQQGSYISVIDLVNTETLSACELRKAPCCNLAESFETNAAVDLSYKDAILGTKEIQMLGLRGLYTQLMMENRPEAVGLGTPYLMNYIPGTWLESIQVSKGTSTVVNGYQSIVGQINAELVKPFKGNRLFVNLFGASTGRTELNINLNKKIDGQWSTGLLLHGSMQQQQLDTNDDGFLDIPLKKHFSGMYRLFYRTELMSAQFNIHGVIQRHSGGQILPDDDFDPKDFYQIKQDAERVTVFGKLAYLGFEKPHNNLGFITNASWHKMDSYYNQVLHKGEQKNFYGNLIYATIIGTTDHKLNYGGSFLYNDYKEQLSESEFNYIESVPGIFAEYTFNKQTTNSSTDESPVRNNNFGLIAGLRLDQHNLYGLLFTPRLNVKYNFSENSIMRASAGRGYRTPNVIAENIGVLASNRVVNILEELEMEDAWNFGLNYAQNFTLNDRDGNLAIDLYRTQFNNQVVMDLEEDHRQILFYNLDGESFSNSFLITTSYELFKGFDIKLAYKFNDVKITFSDGLREKPLVARHRGLMTLDYETNDKTWLFNVTTQLVGPQRLPNNSGIPSEYTQHHPEVSPSYVLLNAQITKIFDKWEIYGGVENITNYTQDKPIIAYQDPFSEYFNANQIYAPTLGMIGNLGVRFIIE